MVRLISPFALLILIGFWISTDVLWKKITGATVAEEPTKANGITVIIILGILGGAVFVAYRNGAIDRVRSRINRLIEERKW